MIYTNIMFVATLVIEWARAAMILEILKAEDANARYLPST